MECYTSDSCDSDCREQKTLDLSSGLLETAAAQAEINRIVEEKHCADKYEIMLAYNNRMTSVPVNISQFTNLKVLDVSNNRLTSLPDVLKYCPLTSLIAKNNRLTNESLPKCFTADNSDLREINLSGNRLSYFPEQVLEISSLRYLYLGGNRIASVPKDIWKLNGLQILALGANRLSDIPESVGRLKSLQALVLADNNIEQLPASIANLNQLKSLLLHKNRIRTLPTEIITLKCLTELSLRDNPLVVRFVRDMTLQPPTLLELAARTVKLHAVPLQPGDIPQSLYAYLESGHCCVNPKCQGVFFDNRVEHIKFVDFCGKYRIPLLQFLCSARCVTAAAWESREREPGSTRHMMRKVLLG